MERLEYYRQCIRKLLTEQATMEVGNPDIECQLIFDAEHDHYQLLDVGWLGLGHQALVKDTCELVFENCSSHCVNTL